MVAEVRNFIAVLLSNIFLRGKRLLAAKGEPLLGLSRKPCRRRSQSSNTNFSRQLKAPDSPRPGFIVTACPRPAAELFDPRPSRCIMGSAARARRVCPGEARPTSRNLRFRPPPRWWGRPVRGPSSFQVRAWRRSDAWGCRQEAGMFKTRNSLSETPRSRVIDGGLAEGTKGKETAMPTITTKDGDRLDGDQLAFLRDWKTERAMLRVIAGAFVAIAVSVPAAGQVKPLPDGFRIREVKTGEDCTIHVRAGGQGPAVVLIHGFGDTGDMWAPLAAEL